MVLDAEIMAERGMTPLLDSRFLPALKKVLSETINCLSLTRNEIRLYINEEVGGDKPFITNQAWDRIWKDNAGAEIKMSEYYQELRDIIELHKAKAKVQLVREVRTATNYLEMNRAQFLINQIVPGISKEPVSGESVGNITILINAPVNLPHPPKDGAELANSADTFTAFELVKTDEA